MKASRTLPAALLTVVFLAGCQNMAQKKQASAQTAPTTQSSTSSSQAGQSAQQTRVDFRLAQTQADKGLKELKFPDGSVWYLPNPVLSRDDLTGVEPRRTKEGQAFVRFSFSQQGAQKLAAVTQRYPGKLLVLTLNDSLVALPRIEKPITNGVLDVGFSSDQQALNVVNAIAGHSGSGGRAGQGSQALQGNQGAQNKKQ